jgi:small subunit ribosomal protein S20
MAHSLSAKKRIRQNAKNRARNRWRTRVIKEALKEFSDKIAHGSAKDAKESFSKIIRILDRSSARGIIHKNNAARSKSRLNARLKAKSAGGAAKTTAKK